MTWEHCDTIEIFRKALNGVEIRRFIGFCFSNYFILLKLPATREANNNEG